MSSDPRTLEFGLRDFLFYVVPGGTILVGALLLARVSPQAVQEFQGIGTSVFALLLAYFLGQVNYGFTYPLRWLFRSRGPWSEESEVFQNAYIWAVERHTAFYWAEIHRYRTLARFSVAMVIPSIVLGLGICVWLYSVRRGGALTLGTLGVLAAAAFVLRYRRYDRVFREHVRRCRRR